MSKLFIFGWRRILFALTLAFVVSLLSLEASQWLIRMRAEALLADIKSLELNRSSWSDAERLMNRWGEWGGWYGNCTAEDCSYDIAIYHLRFVYPGFVFEEGPHLGVRALELVGLRSASVSARFHVVHGVVTNKGFRMDVALPVSRWISPESGFWLKDEVGSAYWPSLDASFFEGAKLRQTNYAQLEEHPNRSFIQRRILLEASFTPEESLEEQAALIDFHFNCLTRWTACTNRGELLLRAEEEFEAEGRELAHDHFKEAPYQLPSRTPSTEICAREEPDVLVGEVVQAEALPILTNSDSQRQSGWLTRVRLKDVLKGGASMHAGDAFRVTVYCNNNDEKCNSPFPNTQIILTGTRVADKPNSEAPDFDVSECGVREATQESLAATRNGVQEDFGPRY